MQKSLIIDNRAVIRLLLWLVAATATMTAPLAATAAPDTPLPININADRASFDGDKSKSVYTGNVVLKRGGLTLTGVKLVLTDARQAGQLHAVLTGSPAQIDKKPGPLGDDTVTGHAQKIIFDRASDRIILQGNAYLKRADGNSVRAQKIVHYLQTERTVAKRGAEDADRVKVILRPEDKSSSAAQ